MKTDEFTDKVLLITGGTGSFGNAVLNKFKTMGLREIRIFSRDEKKQHDMRLSYSDSKIKYYIGDTRNYGSVSQALRGVDYVFHAAALKQVPSCEFFPIEATMTNVLGTDNVIKACIENGVKKVICLSTDKAAYPINAMGMTKALMEKVAVAASRNISVDKTKVCLTRYGNVLASRGSVVPLFVDQILAGSPLTITDPEMTRFIMTLDEAVDLVLFAFSKGSQGDLYVQKAPAATIMNLALALLEIFHADNKIEVIGTRHGEKQYETLCTREEMTKATDLGKYFRIPADERDLNYGLYFSKGNPGATSYQDYNSNNTEILEVEQLKEVLINLPYIQGRLRGSDGEL